MLQAVCYVFACTDPFWILPAHFALKPQNSGIVVRYQCDEMYNGTPTASCGDDGMYMVSGMIRPLLSLSFTYIWKQNDFDWCHVHPFAIICHISTSIAIGVLISNSRRPWLEGVVPLGATMEAAAAVSVGHLQRSTMLHRGEKSTIYRDGGWTVIDEMIWNFNGFHRIYWFHSFLFSSFWYLVLGFVWCKLIQIICSSLHSAATWYPFHISWSFFLGGSVILPDIANPYYNRNCSNPWWEIRSTHWQSCARFNNSDVKGGWFVGMRCPYVCNPGSQTHVGRLLLCDGLYGHREVFSVKFLHLICKKQWRYEGSYWSNIDIQSMSLFLHISCSLWHFQSHTRISRLCHSCVWRGWCHWRFVGTVAFEQVCVSNCQGGNYSVSGHCAPVLCGAPPKLPKVPGGLGIDHFHHFLSTSPPSQATARMEDVTKQNFSFGALVHYTCVKPRHALVA